MYAVVMKTSKYYEVAGHCFMVEAGDADLKQMDNYEPFRLVAMPSQELVFELTISEGLLPVYTEEWRQEDEGQEIICGRTTKGHAVFEFIWNGTKAGWLICRDRYQKGELLLTGQHRKSAIDNALMVQYALATANKGTALFHAAAVSHAGHCYMFLGVSGTGKSTHARLWLQHIGGTELVNDDNPVVRLHDDGQPIAYGSPWSGKTPCYRNISYPLGAIVTLSQAPYNRIHRLNGIEAYIPLMESISGMRWDAEIADGLHLTEHTLVQQLPIWHLECLPDAEAAKLCWETVKTERG